MVDSPSETRSLRLEAIFLDLSTVGDEVTEGGAVFESGLLADIFSLASLRSRAPLVSGNEDEAAGDEGAVAAFNGELLSGVEGFDFDNGGMRGALNGDDFGVPSLEAVFEGRGHSSLEWSVFVMRVSAVFELM